MSHHTTCTTCGTDETVTACTPDLLLAAVLAAEDRAAAWLASPAGRLAEAERLAHPLPGDLVAESRLDEIRDLYTRVRLRGAWEPETLALAAHLCGEAA